MSNLPEAVVLAGGMVYDGTGAPPKKADIALAGGSIVEVGRPGQVSGGELVDVSGCVVAPGFIDIHTHADFSLPTYPAASSMVRQGVTTVVVGNCGFSAFPIGAGERGEMLQEHTSIFGRGLDWQWSDLPGFIEHVESLGPAVNVATLVGHGSVRLAAMGFEDRPPTADELAHMRRLAEESMALGAFGMSSGLIYAPGTYAAQEELTALCRVVAGAGGFYATHMRNEGEHLLKSVDETLAIARGSGVALQMSHHKVLGRRNWGLTEESLSAVDFAIADGLDVTLDQYPYPASSTTLAALLPSWASEGGLDRMRARLSDATDRAAIRREILEGPDDGRPKRDFEPDTVMVSSIASSTGTPLVGLSLREIADQNGVEAVDVMLDLLATDSGVEVVIFSIGEEDIQRVMRHPAVAIASDGWTMHPDAGGRPHPRSYGTFVRVLGEYVRERGILSLAEAIRKMTTLPAGRMGLADRGRIRVGARADIVVFDPRTVAERSTFLEPHAFATGVRSVYVNGVCTVRDGEQTRDRGGSFLRHCTSG